MKPASYPPYGNVSTNSQGYDKANDRTHLLQGTAFAAPPPPAWRKEAEILGLMVLVILFGSLNRVASKIMTHPMGDYSFFLSLFNGIAYVLLYYGILLVRYYTGRVPDEHMKYPWKRMPENYTASRVANNFWYTLAPVKFFIILGFMDSLGNIMGLIATPYLSGPMMSVVSQAIVLFSMICAIIILGTRYTIWQVGAVSVVIGGALIALIPAFKSGGSNQDPFGWLLLYTMSNLPSAISFTVKEYIFRQKKGLELFVVNSTGSLFQLLWWPLMIPITVLLNQTNGKPLGQYIRDGFQCFAGITPKDDTKHDCSPDPYPYLIYIVCNLVFNIFLLLLLKRASALQGFMAIKAILPISVILFMIDWPLIGPSPITVYTVISLIVILIGLGLYRWTTILKEKDAVRMAAANNIINNQFVYNQPQQPQPHYHQPHQPHAQPDVTIDEGEWSKLTRKSDRV